MHMPLRTGLKSRLMPQKVLNGVAIILVCLSTIRAGFGDFTFDILSTSILAVGLLMLGKPTMHIRLSPQFRGVLAIVCIFALVYISQNLFIGNSYYDYWAALVAQILFILMACIGLLCSESMQRRTDFWKLINAIAFLASCLIIIQAIFYISGIDLSRVPFWGEYFFTAWKFATSYRMSAIFSEPSHMAEFVLLSQYYFLFVHINLKKAVFVSLAICITTSGLGIAGVALLWGMYVIHKLISTKQSYYKVFLVVLTMIVAISAIWWLNNSDSWVASRLVSGGTYGKRVARSFELFGEMPWPERIYGIGLQNQANYLNALGLVLPSDSGETLTNREFAQTAGYILCTCGLTGFLACGLGLFISLRKRDLTYLSYLLLFILVCITSCIFSRAIFILYLAVLFAEMGRTGKVVISTKVRRC